MAIVYRDKTTESRILIPTQQGNEDMFENGDWSIECMEVIVNINDRLVYRKAFIPTTILERHYRKEEL